MRIWDIDPKFLCNKHLVAEHRELHGCFRIITVHGCKGGYANHPETKRWYGKSKALRLRHDALVAEGRRRGMNFGIEHKTPITPEFDQGPDIQDQFVDVPQRQIEILKNKPCTCRKNLESSVCLC